MKRKTIKSVCRRVANGVANSITDEEVKKLFMENAIITGGAIASMLLGEKINDFDFYFRTKEATCRIAEYYVETFTQTHGEKYTTAVEQIDDRIRIKIKSAGVASVGDEGGYQYFETVDPDGGEAEAFVENATDLAEKKKSGARTYAPVFMTSNAISLTDNVQLVVRFFGEPEDIHSNYDFVHCMNYWQSWDGKLELKPEAMESLLSRDLRYVGSKYPLCSIIRTRKFLKRDWNITAGQFVKMAWHVNELNLSDPKVLEEQLTGVDFAYFQEIIEALQKADPDKVDATYLFELIDRIF